jgi:anti-sigma factor RsiW
MFLDPARSFIFSVMGDTRTTCQRVEERLTDFLEGAMPDQDYATIQTHLAQCPRCRQTLAELELTISLLSRLPKPRPRTHESARNIEHDES